MITSRYDPAEIDPVASGDRMKSAAPGAAAGGFQPTTLTGVSCALVVVPPATTAPSCKLGAVVVRSEPLMRALLARNARGVLITLVPTIVETPSWVCPG